MGNERKRTGRDALKCGIALGLSGLVGILGIPQCKNGDNPEHNQLVEKSPETRSDEELLYKEMSDILGWDSSEFKSQQAGDNGKIYFEPTLKISDGEPLGWIEGGLGAYIRRYPGEETEIGFFGSIQRGVQYEQKQGAEYLTVFRGDFIKRYTRKSKQEGWKEQVLDEKGSKKDNSFQVKKWLDLVELVKDKFPE